MKKRGSYLRKTIAGNSAVHDEVVDYAPPQPQPNTNADMYATNNLYRMLCVYCNSSEKFLVNHYMKQHPEHEGKSKIENVNENVYTFLFQFYSFIQFQLPVFHQTWLIDCENKPKNLN